MDTNETDATTDTNQPDDELVIQYSLTYTSEAARDELLANMEEHIGLNVTLGDTTIEVLSHGPLTTGDPTFIPTTTSEPWDLMTTEETSVTEESS